MGKSGKKRRKKTIGYNHLGMFGISLIVLILILTLMAQSRDLKESLAGYETRAEALSQQIEEEQVRTQEIEDLKQAVAKDQYRTPCKSPDEKPDLIVDIYAHSLTEQPCK